MIFEGLVNVVGGEIYCKLIGDERNDVPVIVVFPGGPGFGHEIYEGHSGFIAEHAQMLFFDPRGSGRSSRAITPSEYTLDNYVRDAKAIIDHFEFEKVIILGTSYGSMAALNFAIQYPENTQKLILVGGAPSHNFIEPAKEELVKRGSAEQMAVCEKLFSGSFESEDEASEFLRIMAPLYSNKAKREGASPFKAKCSIDPLNAAFRTRFDHFDYLEQLEELEMPALLMVGENDWINPVNQVSLMAEKIKHSTLLVVKDSGHSVAVDRPDVYRSSVIDFINIPSCEKNCRVTLGMRK